MDGSRFKTLKTKVVISNKYLAIILFIQTVMLATFKPVSQQSSLNIEVLSFRKIVEKLLLKFTIKSPTG
jgi:hypothetical protein